MKRFLLALRAALAAFVASWRGSASAPALGSYRKAAERELMRFIVGPTARDRASRRRIARAGRRGRRGSRRVVLVSPVPVIPSSYGSADAAPTNATFAPYFGDPEAIRIQRVEAKVDHMRAFLDEVPLAPLEPTEGEVKP